MIENRVYFWKQQLRNIERPFLLSSIVLIDHNGQKNKVLKNGLYLCARMYACVCKKKKERKKIKEIIVDKRREYSVFWDILADFPRASRVRELLLFINWIEPGRIGDSRRRTRRSDAAEATGCVFGPSCCRLVEPRVGNNSPPHDKNRSS